jgi:hypothetical protein
MHELPLGAHRRGPGRLLSLLAATIHFL